MWRVRPSVLAGIACTLLSGAGELHAQVENEPSSAEGSTPSRVYFGVELARIEDLNGDGLAEILVATGTWAKDCPVWVLSGKRDRLLHVVSPEGRSGYFGSSIAGLGDVDGDGFSDFVVGVYQPSTDRYGEAVVYSGRSGEELGHARSTEAGDGFGWVVRAAGDLNRDGHGDFVVGAPFASLSASAERAEKAGSIVAWSGKDFRVLLRHRGRASGENLGWSLAGGHDLDGDSVPDVLAGAGGVRPGRVDLVSGKTGVAKTLIVQPAPAAHERKTPWQPESHRYASGLEVVEGPSTNRGIRVLVSSVGQDACTVELFSGRDLSRQLLLVGEPESSFGESVCLLNHSRAPRVLVGVPDHGLYVGTVRVFEGTTGEELRRIEAKPEDHHFGLAMLRVDDCNGDGVDDFVVSRVDYANAQLPGELRFYCGVESTLIDSLVLADLEE